MEYGVQTEERKHIPVGLMPQPYSGRGMRPRAPFALLYLLASAINQSLAPQLEPTEPTEGKKGNRLDDLVFVTHTRTRTPTASP